MNRKKVIFAVILLIIDQISKALAQIFTINISLVKSFFSLTYFQNTGGAWSILEGKQFLLIVISLLMLFLVYNMMFSYASSTLNDLAFGILFGGILGNLIDRIIFGYVRDFLAFNIFDYAFPIFNIADAGIVIGVIMVGIITLRGGIKKCK